MKIISGIHKLLIERLIWGHLFWIAFKQYRNVRQTLKAVLGLDNLRKAYMGDHPVMRIAKIGKKYSWHPNIPSWPSKAFKTFHEIELNKILPFRSSPEDLTLLILSITKKCPLNCKHCFEWDIMHRKEMLSLEDLKQIVRHQQASGLALLELSGGEPLNRFKDLIELIKFASKKSEVWVLSSGYGLSLKKAKALQEAGLTGVTISLDHYDEKEHNIFRGNDKSFFWAKEAVKHANEVGLSTCLSVCATRNFATEENLMSYTELAKSWKVGYVQILEPKAKGKFYDQDVLLPAVQIELITDFHFKINTDLKFKDYPIIIYHGYHQRRLGCLGGGNRYKYIDSDGAIFPCPFCTAPMGNIKDIINGISESKVACGSFEFAAENK